MKRLFKLRLPTLMLALWLAQAGPALAQATKAADESPAVKTDQDGTTVVGDRESPIGLYITPWRNDTPEAALDRPARFLEEQLLPIDADVFRRQIEYYNTITDHQRVRAGAVPKSK
ncbi:MAG: hypothetical protein V4650_00940 [Pseudomonadota bacterium]